MSTPSTSSLQKAIDAVGTAQSFAKKVGVTPQAVSQWRVVPALRVLQVEAITGVSRYDLRPDIYGEAPETNMAMAG